MLVADLEYLQPLGRSKCIEGGVYTYAEANANASSESAEASALAIAEGDSITARTKTSVVFSSGKYVNYSSASASSFASAKTGYQYSIAFDYAFDADVSPNR